MGATVSVIDEELTRPMDGEDLNCDGVIDIENVRRLRQLLHITFSSDKGDQLSESLNDAALTPSFAREINDLLTKCAGDPGIARLANDKILRRLLREQSVQRDKRQDQGGDSDGLARSLNFEPRNSLSNSFGQNSTGLASSFNPSQYQQPKRLQAEGENPHACEAAQSSSFSSSVSPSLSSLLPVSTSCAPHMQRNYGRANTWNENDDDGYRIGEDNNQMNENHDPAAQRLGNSDGLQGIRDAMTNTSDSSHRAAPGLEKGSQKGPTRRETRRVASYRRRPRLKSKQMKISDLAVWLAKSRIAKREQQRAKQARDAEMLQKLRMQDEGVSRGVMLPTNLASQSREQGDDQKNTTPLLRILDDDLPNPRYNIEGKSDRAKHEQQDPKPIVRAVSFSRRSSVSSDDLNSKSAEKIAPGTPPALLRLSTLSSDESKDDASGAATGAAGNNWKRTNLVIDATADSVREMAQHQISREIATPSSLEEQDVFGQSMASDDLLSASGNSSSLDLNSSNHGPNVSARESRNALRLGIEVPGPGVGMDGEAINILENSCILSQSGALAIADFKITKDGIVSSPSTKNNRSEEFSDNVGEMTDVVPSNGTNIVGRHSSRELGGVVDAQNHERWECIPPDQGVIRRPLVNKPRKGGGHRALLPISPLGAGASGTVFKALHMRSLRLVALKNLPIYDPTKRSQMIRELRLLYAWQRDSINSSSEPTSKSANDIFSAIAPASSTKAIVATETQHTKLCSEGSLSTSYHSFWDHKRISVYREREGESGGESKLSEGSLDRGQGEHSSDADDCPSHETKPGNIDSNERSDGQIHPYGNGPCPYIVKFYDAFVNADSGSVSLVVEYMNGGSLQDLVDKGGCQDESFLASVAARTLRGIDFLHRILSPPKLHRDIKPANILINMDGECKVADFGIYREMGNDTAANTFIGSLTYMSPERIKNEPYGCPADIWAVGLTLLTVALGRCPITDNGKGFWSILHELTEKDPPELPHGPKYPGTSNAISGSVRLRKTLDTRNIDRKLEVESTIFNTDVRGGKNQDNLEYSSENEHWERQSSGAAEEVEYDDDYEDIEIFSTDEGGEEEWSGDFRAFLKRMLMKEPGDRATAQELLDDPFLRRHGVACANFDSTKNDPTLPNQMHRKHASKESTAPSMEGAIAPILSPLSIVQLESRLNNNSSTLEEMSESTEHDKETQQQQDQIKRFELDELLTALAHHAKVILSMADENERRSQMASGQSESADICSRNDLNVTGETLDSSTENDLSSPGLLIQYDIDAKLALPGINDEKMKGLAMQIGLSFEEVRTTFDMKLRGILNSM